MEINAKKLSFDKKKLLLALIYNVLVSDQDYADTEKYLFSTLVDLIDVPFSFNKDMLSKKDIIKQMQTLSKAELDIFIETVRLAIEADGKITDDEIEFFSDVLKGLNFNSFQIEEKIDFLKFGEKL